MVSLHGVRFRAPSPRLLIEHADDAVCALRCCDLLDDIFREDERLLRGSIRFSFMIQVFISNAPTWAGHYQVSPAGAPLYHSEFARVAVVTAPDVVELGEFESDSEAHGDNVSEVEAHGDYVSEYDDGDALRGDAE